MKYSDGTEMLAGDKVTVDGEKGTVVAVLDTEQYTEAYPEGWAFLKIGALIETPVMGLIHYEKPDEDLVFIMRAKEQ